MKNKLKYIDLFSDYSRFSLRFDNKGFQNVFSIDIEPSFYGTYKYNFPKHQLIENYKTVILQKKFLTLK